MFREKERTVFVCVVDGEGVQFVKEYISEKSTAGQICREDNCVHLDQLRYVKASIRKASHEMSQSLMVMHGYLELFKMGKYGQDVDSMKQILASFYKQMEALLEIQKMIKEAVCPKQ